MKGYQEQGGARSASGVADRELKQSRPALIAAALLLGTLAMVLIQWQTARLLGAELGGFLEDGLLVTVDASTLER